MAAGSYIKFNVSGIDEVLVRVVLGLGVIAFVVWCFSFYNIGYKSAMIVFSFSLG